MIGEGRFQAQLSDVGEILRRLDLLEERQLSPNKSLGAAHFRGMPYRVVYDECVREFAYDFRLVDQSLLLFVNVREASALSYSYLAAPVAAMTYSEFVADSFGVSPIGDEFNDLFDEAGDELRANYELYIATLPTREGITPIRYDYAARDYRAGVHPASHVHFGFKNNIRIATRRVLNPISFLLMLIRQCYPVKWELFVSFDAADAYCKHVREVLPKVEEMYWQPDDEREIALH